MSAAVVSPAPAFDAAAYLAGMRALGSYFYVTRDTATGKEAFVEGMPVDGWTDDGMAEMLRLMGACRACPTATREIVDLLMAEGEVHLWSSAPDVSVAA